MTSLVAVGLIALGAGTLLGGKISRAPGTGERADSVATPAARPSPNPSQALSAFREKLVPLAPDDGAEQLAAEYRKLQDKRFGSSTASVRFGLTRTLEQGQEYDSSLVLKFAEHPQGDRLYFEISPHGGKPAEYLARLENYRTTALEMKPAGASKADRMAVEGELPITVGDLPLQDALEFFPLTRASLTPVGWIEDLGSRRLLVMEQKSRTARSDQPKDAIAATVAWVYVAPEEAELRKIRIFDRDGRLQRVYEDFRFDKSTSNWRLQGFRVTSPTKRSHSVFYIHQLDLENQVDVPVSLGGPSP